jgi:L-iditol 2-dehydrogenase
LSRGWSNALGAERRGARQARVLVARLHGVGDLRLGSEPVPVLGPGTSLVKVGAVGICGSDL